jgi:hypothetical protein
MGRRGGRPPACYCPQDVHVLWGCRGGASLSACCCRQVVVHVLRVLRGRMVLCGGRLLSCMLFQDIWWAAAACCCLQEGRLVLSGVCLCLLLRAGCAD